MATNNKKVLKLQSCNTKSMCTDYQLIHENKNVWLKEYVKKDALKS